MSRQGIAAFVVSAVMIAATVAGCSEGPARSAYSGAAPSPPPAAVTAAVPRLHGVEVFSRTYRLSPSGPLAQPQTVRLPLTRQVPSGWAVIVATAETSGGPWSYLPATLSTDRRTAIFTTAHHSIFTVIGEDVGSLLGFFKTQFLDGLSSGATALAAQPSCAGEAAARSGYTVQSSTGPTVFWCFGMDSSGQQILRVVNNRLYASTPWRFSIRGWPWPIGQPLTTARWHHFLTCCPASCRSWLPVRKSATASASHPGRRPARRLPSTASAKACSPCRPASTPC